MDGIYRLREMFEKIYSHWGNYLNSLAKFLMALLLFLQINNRIGSEGVLNNIFVVLILALFCSFLPINAVLLLGSLMVLTQLYALSLPALIVGGGILAILLLIYFGFAKTQGYAVVLMPLALMLHIPCSIPLAFGLLGKPLAGVAIAAGTVGYYAIAAVTGNAGADVKLAMAETSGEEAILDEIKAMMDAVFQEQEMVLMLLALLAVLFVVYFARRMAMKHAWSVAIAAGTLIYTVLVFAGSLMLTMRTGILGAAAGIVFSVLIAVVLEICFFHLDYTQIEKLQFEDDEYYYYVQAIPKKYAGKGKTRRMNRKGREQSEGNEIIYP